MRKTTIFCVILLCLILSGCQQAKIDDLVNIIDSNPEKYLGEFDELTYISSEYDSEKDVYNLYYQKKIEKNNIIRTHDLITHFYISEGEWIHNDTDTEFVNAYLNIVDTNWRTTPIKHWSEQANDYVTYGYDIRILSVSNDSNEISLMYGSETINFTREHTERDDIEFAYISTNRSEPILMRYNIAPSGKIRILFYLNYKPSDWGIMPDLEYTLIG